MKKIYSILLCIGLVASFVACEKDKDFALTTLSVANETITPWYESAEVSCSFKADATISEACVQYALSSSFVEYQTAEMAEEKGVYSAQLTDLQSDTMYYVRYVVSNKYSQVVSEAVVDFRTLQPVVPIVVLDTVSEVWDHRAIAQMRLVFYGGAAVTDMGICWGAQPHPTMKDIHRSTDDTLALIDITSLQPNTKYYARAYAVNKVGVAYSEEKEFVTLTQPEVRTDEVRDIELTSAVLVGKLLFNGNDTATIKGFCWGEKAVPTVDDDQVAIDTLTDEYSYLLSNLKDETQYFVRAYAKNKIGVVYGEERVFTTQAAVAPKVVTKEVKDVDDQSATVQGEVTSDGGAEVTERGVVYGTSENPTVENSKVTSGAGIGAFTCNLTGLQPNTKYYVRAYAVNKKGTAYGGQVSFTTLTPSNGKENGYEWVDLGLSVKWADRNVGATKPEEYGDYFAWGETEPKEVYDWSTYKWCNGSKTTLTKYCTDGSYGTVDNKTQLELSDDAAHANWGGSWRMPTEAEQEELRANCTWTWTTQNGVNGYKVTSKKSGYTNNSIFLPAAGYCDVSSLSYAGRDGNYWSSSLYGDPRFAWGVYSYSDYVHRHYNSRFYGQSVRPVYGEYVPAINLPVITTGVVTQITETTAVAGGNVTSDGGASVTERGVVYGTSENPTVGNSKVVGGSGTGMFTCNLTGLQPNTKYYVRAYAVNKKGTVYGEQVSFTTLTPIVVPTVMTHVITQIAETTAVAGGNVTADGGASVTERGVVYSTSENPTTANSKVVGGNGTGMFTCNLTDLQPNTKYYVRAYAVNSKGTAYGEQVSFTTLEEVKTTAEYVDLGLSVKWATVNVGATKPEEYGDYFAWGETEPKSTYNWSTYKWCNGSETTLTKYCTDGSYGTVDNKTQLELSDDASHVNWGSDWRIPTDAELNELVNECTWTWIAQNGVKGYKVIGSNGNSIFLPAAGFRSNSDELTSSETGNSGVYASRTLVSFGPSYSLYLFFDNENKGWSTMYRYVGYTIRPVYGAMPENSLASVTSSAVTQITETTAVAGGKVTADGGSIVLECGVVYGTSQNPTTDDKKVTSDDGSGDYTCNLTDLQASTTYYVRAYAVNSKGTAYGEQVSFTTLEEVSATPEYVDLGLSVKWATFNVGATKPEEYGDYFAWGETEPKEVYDLSTYVWYNDSEYTLTKYNNSSDQGTVDNKTQLELSDDAAHVNWGGDWRMPTDTEFTELRENCTWTWTTQNGVNGYKVTSKSNGNSIFLPAAGYRNISSLDYAGSSGGYWSSSLDTGDPYGAYYLDFGSSYVGWGSTSRNYGHSVRPVYGEYVPAINLPVITTSTITQIAETTAVAGGNVTADGGASVTERGVVYGISENPTTASSKVVGGNGTGMFTCNLTGLQPNTKYYVRAYAVNSKGTAYGEQVSFTTLEEVSATPEYVDLGLSVKWADRNVGADKPEDYGDYFAWGETEPKEVYGWSTYKWCNGSQNTLTKYNHSSPSGTVDNKTQLEPEDDAARVIWGGDWRMPTDTEFTELRENCTWTWTTQNGVNGCKVTSKSNGNSIFLPAAGARNDSGLSGAGSSGDYWSSSLSTDNPSGAYGLDFLSDYVGRYYDYYFRYYGRSVRPVYEEYIPASTMPTVTTSAVTQITETTAVAGGNVTADGGASVTERGVVYSTTANPTTANTKKVSSSGTGAFTCNLTGLQASTTYYVRAYAINEKGTAYGEQVSFTTLTPIVPPTITTSAVTQITETTAVAGGNVTADGGASVTERGVVYSTSENPTTASGKVVNGSGTGAFTCNLTGLQASTTYYVRAYAINEKGTAYGEQVTFKTLEEVSATPVDLGLSVKWADRNVGATKPEEYGDYFAWGETAPKEVYDWSTYKWCNGSETTLTKYCTDGSYGTVDNKTQLELSDDAAHANWGGSWRMPTQAEQNELREQCTWTWTTQNGVNGYKVTSKSNGNSIFLPAAGRRYRSSLNSAGSNGYCWSSSLVTDDPSRAYELGFTSGYVGRNYDGHYLGQSVRPVYGEYVPASTMPTVTTSAVTQITETTAVAGGNVTADGGASVTERGVVYSTTANPTTANTKKVSGSGTGAFTCNLTGLQASTTYYVRAYAINEKGTAYGEQVTFKTLTPIVPPTITTSAVTQITETTAVAGGNVTADGGASVTERGVVYSTSENPTTANSKVVGGNGTGAFTCNLTGLQASTTYYVRAYAINEKGTAYGEQVSFTTLEEVSATPEYVDLGLSVKWATVNVGATKPEEYGDYFAWGETEPKSTYNWSTYKWCNGSETTLTKYCTDGSYGTIDNKTQLELSDDAAHVNWGGSWRMPTDTEFTELRENCTWTWTTQNGVKGCKVTSKSNGNSIFLPAAGCRLDSSLGDAGSYGNYWSGSLSTGYPEVGLYVSFGLSNVVVRGGYFRCSGFSVRPVYGEYIPASTMPTVTTSAVTQITETTAVAGGNVTSDGGASVTERGVVYSTSENPTTASSKVVGGSGTGAFTCNLADLQAGTTYYVRAYAVNSQGTAYGEQVSFTTLTPSNGMENGYEWVDLGLSVKWATFNVGANKPEEYGDYFAWGETEPKEVYDRSTYKWCNGSETTLTKYCTDDSLGIVDNKTQLELSDDAARVNWGGSWRMPTQAEQNELREQCTWTWTTQNGVNGYKVTSKSNGNSIFLPAAGHRYGSSFYSAGSDGDYWSSSLYTDYPHSAWHVYFYPGYVNREGTLRSSGFSVRPVCQ